jgi:hypothetical protein
MIVLICGSRHWNDYATMENFINKLPENTVIIHGDSEGADKIGGFLGEKRGLKVIKEPAKFSKFGLYAGPLRNAAMIHNHEPTIVVAFHDNLKNSKGTKNMVFQAQLSKIKVIIIRSRNYHEKEDSQI